MTTKLIVGPIDKGLTTNRLPFNIDNNSFPTLINAYQWRGRIKRKRGTEFLTRLQVFLGVTNGSGDLAVTISTTPILVGISSFVIGTDIFVDPGGASPVNLITNGSGSATLNRATGVLTITGSIAATNVNYFPRLPVLGLEDFILNTEEFTQTICFDTKYSYGILPAFPYTSYNVSFYKNPAVDAVTLPGYVPKATWTPLSWNGQDYQQFWTINYEGAFWATNGIEIPFDPTNVGMQYGTVTTVTVVSPTSATLAIAGHPLVIGDFIFVNEVLTTTGINFQTGYVTAVVAGVSVTAIFPNAAIATNGTGGIAQYLTNRSDATKDCIRYYDGDPTNGSIIAPGFLQGKGWVNFMPPLSQSTFTVGDAPPAQYYLVGARIITAYKDRLIFFGPVIQTSAVSSQIYLADTIVYCQNGTPFYAASYTNKPTATIDTPTSASNVFFPFLVPENQTASPPSWFSDQTGFGGYIDSGLDESINTLGSNEDALILGFDTQNVRMVYTGNDIVPFNLFIINSELGSTSTFSSINMDQGVMARGNRGYTITSQTSTQRIDLDNPDKVFEVANVNNGTERFTAQRDFINEWIYFSYCANDEDETQYRFPTETFQLNYRDNSWAVFRECYTTYGQFKKLQGFIWATVGFVYPTWADWNDPWDSGISTQLQPLVIGGNQQGFILIRGIGTGEGNSLIINNIVGSLVSSPEHCLDNGDYIVITGVLGSIGQYVNGKTFSVVSPTISGFTLNPAIPTGTYLGGGLISRRHVPDIKTKQFPLAWEIERKTRIGVQQYLLNKTARGEITLKIYLSTDNTNAYNDGPIVPEIEPENNGLIYSTVLYTCPESTNLGLTPANTNLQQLNLIGTNGQSSNNQQQLWHRINTSLLGDTVQLGFTLSDAQMRSLLATGTSFAITAATQASPVVLDTPGKFGAGTLVKITGVVGMDELNFDAGQNNYYNVISSTGTTTTIEVNGSAFDAYVSGGTIVAVANFNATEEIVLNGFLMNVTPSGLLS